MLSNPGFQLRIIFIFAFLAILYAATNYVVSKNSLRTISEAIRELRLTAENRSDLALVMHEQNVTLDLQLMLLTFLSFFVLVMGGVFLSHVLGGPIYRMNKYMRQVVDGKEPLHKITFRRYDFFHDFADNFNKFQETQGLFSKKSDEPGETPPDPEG